MTNSETSVFLVNLGELRVYFGKESESEVVLFWGTVAVSELSDMLDELSFNLTEAFGFLTLVEVSIHMNV